MYGTVPIHDTGCGSPPVLIDLRLVFTAHAQPGCDAFAHPFACVWFLLAIVHAVVLDIDLVAGFGDHVLPVARTLRTDGSWTRIHSFVMRGGHPCRLQTDCDGTL